MGEYRVKVLKQGYCRSAGAGRQYADGTITLLDGRQPVLIDTGGPWDRAALIAALAAEGLSPERIAVVVCTHGHSDHTGNLNLFADALLIVGYDISEGDCYTDHDFAGGRPYEIDEQLQVIATPGHTAEDVSVLAKTAAGVVALVGDLFECEADLADERLWRARSADPARQEQSRNKVLALADRIVPGHGAMFAVPGRVS